MFRIKRAYAPPSPDDGFRVLIDRLWPRGLSKEAAAIDEWLKDVAPSAELRKWFGHDPKRWATFKARYREELKTPARSAGLEHLRALGRERSVTLLFAARDETHNHAAALLEVLTDGTDRRES